MKTRASSLSVPLALVLLGLAAVPAAPAGSTAAQPRAAKPSAAVDEKQESTAGERPLARLPYTPSLDPAFMDRSVDPCVDLYTYSCGGWMKQNPIPADQSAWSVYGKAYAENQRYLWGILEEAARPDPARSPQRQKIGDFFAACMDEAEVEKRGVSPLAKDLDSLAALKNVRDIAAWLAATHLRVPGGYQPSLFAFRAKQDPGNSEQVIAWVQAAGLGLPDRDYYVKTDARSIEIRRRYLSHVSAVLRLIGEPEKRSEEDAGVVLRIETALARASLPRAEKRDPYKTYHKMTVAELQKLTPSFAWKDYLGGLGAGGAGALNVTEPDFFRALETALRTESLEDWKTYLKWHLLKNEAPFLSSAFVKTDFDFYRAYLRGAKEMEPRWKRCVRYVDRDLGEALGKVFVEKTFPAKTKAEVRDMVSRIEKAMRSRIEGLDWMSEATKKQALRKLSAVRDKIGYPDRWRDYSSLDIVAGDFFGNVRRATSFESRRQVGKIGRPVDRDEWDMTPPTVNAYYNPSMNDINFPAGVLLPPLYDPSIDDAPNYGDTGSTIGHELTHGFDDEGRKFDAEGNLKDWWTGADSEEFEKRASCVADQYARYVIVDDIRINSRLTLGEDVADLGGTILAWAAWKDATAGRTLRPRDGLTPEQRFFVGFAQWACENRRDEDKRVNALTNPHSPAIDRINGVVANMPEFAAVFSCKPSAPLVKRKVCKVW